MMDSDVIKSLESRGQNLTISSGSFGVSQFISKSNIGVVRFPLNLSHCIPSPPPASSISESMRTVCTYVYDGSFTDYLYPSLNINKISGISSNGVLEGVSDPRKDGKPAAAVR